MNKPNLELGKKLDIDFDGHPVSLYKSLGEYYVECKDVFVNYNNYKAWKEDPSDNLFGHTADGRACKIDIINHMVRIGCLKDTEANFNKIVIIVNKYIRNDKKSSNCTNTREASEFIGRR